VRKQHLQAEPTCRVCGGRDKIEVHHKKSFCKNPELELDRKNLITLCESKKNGVNCHLFFGHLGNYRTINSNVDKDVSAWQSKIKNRKNI
jgi:5-methylcytosine-specific restriction endonuclease McrA